MPVAIVVPTYNSALFLAETLQSISQQTRQPDEVLLIDDGSRDDTPAISAAWAKAQRFDVRLLPNRFPDAAQPGPAGGRHTGLLEAKADLIALLDHDDLLEPEHLAQTEQAFRHDPRLVLCFGDSLAWDTATGRQTSFFAGKRIEQLAYRPPLAALPTLRVLTEPLLPSLIAEGSYIPTASNLWRRQAAIAAGGFDPRAGSCDDLLFFMRLSRQGPIAYYPFALSRKRIHGGNLSHPQNSLRLVTNACEAYRLLLADADLPAAERDLLGRRIGALEDEILYHASNLGLGAYWNARQRLSQDAAGARNAARAFVRSSRKLLGFK